jgi:hypothetical protein
MPRLSTVVVVLLGPLVLLWPLPIVFADAVLAAPDQEAATHIWGLWAALEHHMPLVVDSPLLNWPDGQRLVLVDPANLPAFAIGSLISPAAAYNLVLAAGVALMGVAGALLAGQIGAHPTLTAAIAMATPTVLANAADGQTEGFAVGWVGIQLALLIRCLRGGPAWGVALAGLALALCWYGGPYNGVFAALLNIGLVAGWPKQGRRLAWPRAALVAVLAVALCAPLAAAVLQDRPSGLPGDPSRAGPLNLVENPRIFRGGMQTGADMLDPWLPAALTGGEAEVSHTAYLGAFVLLLAVLAVARDRRRWPWLAGGLSFAVLSWGPWLSVGGLGLRIDNQLVTGPAGWLAAGVPVLDRLTRWYRAGAVASLLLAPLAALGAAELTRGWRARPHRHTTALVTIGAVVWVDALLLAPLKWPLHQTPLPDRAPWRAADLLDPSRREALVELPPVTSATPPPGAWRDQVGVLQPLHGRPVGGGIMGVRASPAALRCGGAVSQLLRDGVLSKSDRQRCLGDGFRFAAIHRTYFRAPDAARAHAEACLGSAVYADPNIWLLDLRGGKLAEDCAGRPMTGGVEPLPPTGGPSVTGLGAIDTPRPGK